MAKNQKAIWVIIAIVLGIALIGPKLGLFAVSTNFDSCASYPIGNYTNLVSNGDFELGTWGNAGDCNCGMASCKNSAYFNPSDYQNWKVDITSTTLGQEGSFSKKDGAGNFVQQGTFSFFARESEDKPLDSSGFKSLELSGRRAYACNGKTITGIKPNTQYTFSFWFKAVNTAADAYSSPRFIIVQNNGSKEFYTPTAEFSVEDNDWHYYQTTFTTLPAVNKLSVNFYANGKAGEDAASIATNRYDEVRLVEGSLQCLSPIETGTGGETPKTEFDFSKVLFKIGDFEVTYLIALIAGGIGILLFILKK